MKYRIEIALKSARERPGFLIASELAHVNLKPDAIELQATDLWFSLFVGILISLVALTFILLNVAGLE